jgi:hypothetical protein
MTAYGVSSPPFLMFSRKRVDHKVFRGRRPGTVGLSYDKEYETTEVFMLYLKHFLEHTKPSVDVQLSSLWTITTAIILPRRNSNDW